jgi:hypothetical protein
LLSLFLMPEFSSENFASKVFALSGRRGVTNDVRIQGQRLFSERFMVEDTVHRRGASKTVQLELELSLPDREPVGLVIGLKVFSLNSFRNDRQGFQRGRLAFAASLDGNIVAILQEEEGTKHWTMVNTTEDRLNEKHPIFALVQGKWYTVSLYDVAGVGYTCSFVRLFKRGALCVNGFSIPCSEAPCLTRAEHRAAARKRPSDSNIDDVSGKRHCEGFLRCEDDFLQLAGLCDSDSSPADSSDVSWRSSPADSSDASWRSPNSSSPDSSPDSSSCVDSPLESPLETRDSLLDFVPLSRKPLYCDLDFGDAECDLQGLGIGFLEPTLLTGLDFCELEPTFDLQDFDS